MRFDGTDTLAGHSDFLTGIQAVTTSLSSPAPGGSTGVTVRQPAITVTGATGVPGIAPATYPMQPSTALKFSSIDSGCGEAQSATTLSPVAAIVASRTMVRMTFSSAV